MVAEDASVLVWLEQDGEGDRGVGRSEAGGDGEVHCPQ